MSPSITKTIIIKIIVVIIIIVITIIIDDDICWYNLKKIITIKKN